MGWKNAGAGFGGAAAVWRIGRQPVGRSKLVRGCSFESWKKSAWIFNGPGDSSKKSKKDIAGTGPDCRPETPAARSMKSRNEVVALVRAKIRLLHFALSTEDSYCGSLQRAVHAAACWIGLDGLITPHVLRHAYATHSRESIEALRILMGHVSIETTAGYRHPAVETATNPLDDLAG